MSELKPGQWLRILSRKRGDAWGGHSGQREPSVQRHRGVKTRNLGQV